MGPANTQQEARQNWVTPYAFEPSNGGLGILLATSGTIQRVSLATLGSGNAIAADVGMVAVHLAWGDSNVLVTTNHHRLIADATQIVTIPKEVNGVEPTHFAIITAGSVGDCQITRGFGI